MYETIYKNIRKINFPHISNVIMHQSVQGGMETNVIERNVCEFGMLLDCV